MNKIIFHGKKKIIRLGIRRPGFATTASRMILDKSLSIHRPLLLLPLTWASYLSSHFVVN